MVTLLFYLIKLGIMNTEKITPVSLRELLEASELAISYNKKENEWGHAGVLGFPAVILLLSFVDAAGYLLCVKGTEKDCGANSIPGENFEILRNQKYFTLTLSEKLKDKLSNNFRGYVLH